MLHSTLSTFPSLLLRVSCWPFWTLPSLPAGCSCPQAVPQPQSFPSLAPQRCCPAVTPTASPQPARGCVGGGGSPEEWPAAPGWPFPLLSRLCWPEETPRECTEQSAQSTPCPPWSRWHCPQDSKRDRAWGRAEVTRGIPAGKGNGGGTSCPGHGAHQMICLPSSSRLVLFSLFPPLSFSQKVTQHEKYCKPAVSNCPWQHYFVPVTLSQHPLCNKCSLGQSFLGQHSLITMLLMILILILMLVMIS